MKNNPFTLFSTTALAVGALLLLVPSAVTAQTNQRLDSTDRKFIQEEAAAGAALVRIAELGVQRAESADIKAYAQMIVTEHTNANTELQRLARSKGVELTADVSRKHNRAHKKLADERGEKFDKEFLSTIVKSHKKCLENYEDAVEDAEDREVKMWATRRVPVLQSHLDQAERLSSGPMHNVGAASGAMTTPAHDNTARTMRDRDASTRDATARDTSARDNTARAMRDRDGAARGTTDRQDTTRSMRDHDQNLTPFDQGNSRADIDTTTQIRKAILDLDNISVNAKNVKIITKDGHVALRGRVNSDNEMRLIVGIAQRIAAGFVDNQLEVRGTDNTQ